MLVFGYTLKWFPVYSVGRNVWENFYYLAMPSLALALNMVALIARITRSNMIEQLNSPYAATAVAKGTPYGKLVMGHCFRNAVIPVITVTSIQFGGLLIDAIKSSDYPVTQSITLMMVALFLLINLAVDIVYAAIDPRIRLK